jgi:xanthine dehydrogenase accessory factor
VTEVYEELLKLKANGESGVLITVVEKEGHGPTVVGTKMVMTRAGQKRGTIGGGALEFAATKHASTLMESQTSGLKKYLLSPDNEVIDGEPTGMLCGGAITLFFEYIGSGAKLYLFGAGHIGKALVYHLKHLDYYITLLDNRQGMVETIADVQRRLTTSYENALQDEAVPPHSYFLIASHSHQLDYVILKRIVKAQWSPQYIGMVASKRKTPLMIQRLKEEVGADVNLEALYSPVGLDIGGQSPYEIAISVIAELQVLRYHKEGHKHMGRWEDRK